MGGLENLKFPHLFHVCAPFINHLYQDIRIVPDNALPDSRIGIDHNSRSILVDWETEIRNMHNFSLPLTADLTVYRITRLNAFSCLV